MKKKILYLGIDPPIKADSKYIFDKENSQLIHYPIIKTVPSKKFNLFLAFKNFLQFTHIIFTSKTTVRIFFETLKELSFSFEEISQKQYIVVGKSTAHVLKEYDITPTWIAEEETATGIVALLKNLNLKNSFIFFPHSKLSRNTIITFLLNENLKFEESYFYDTIPFKSGPLPDLKTVDEIVFTSPSTVDAFLTFFKTLPQNKILTPIGPVTNLRLEKKL